MSEGPRSADVRPKAGPRSWSADSVWPRRKQRTRKQASPAGGATAGPGHRSRATSCPGRKCSSSDADQAVSRRSLRQKFQDAVGLCLPLRPPRVRGPGPVRGSILVWSKRRVHVSELECPANRWSLHNQNLQNLQSLHSLQNQNLQNQQNLNQVQIKNQLSDVDLNGNSALCWDDLCSPAPSEALAPPSEWILVPDLLQISNSPCYWGVLDRFEAEALLEGTPEGTFLLRDSAHSEVLFSVSFRRYSRSLHARIEQSGHVFSFDVGDPGMYRSPSVGGLLRHYSDPQTCLFFEPLLAHGLPRRHAFSLQHLSRCVICSCTTFSGLQRLPLPPHLQDYLTHYHLKT